MIKHTVLVWSLKPKKENLKNSFYYSQLNINKIPITVLIVKVKTCGWNMPVSQFFKVGKNMFEVF